ncbi:DUF2889 domain-containing protein [Pseudonocardia kunmingensis]|uniref:DUF2889 family protein n=1 Tax=Pseudonocardia kunmingensis TaxID=630975 RepID=A0A543DPE7_9PSEU|nr:DUF2889 domain-containing protein [Pseudonocardia kunmingensis]TQM11188.1 DUF2889 family protein [Pseudonocardia kunmingensis]
MAVPVLGPLHPRHGTHAPTSGTPARAAGSVRRTATTDMLRPEGLTGPLVLLGRARDLVTTPEGTARVVDEASCRAVVEFVEGRILREVESHPARPALQTLIGTPVSSGFRAAVLAADPSVPDEAGLLHLLLDDFPVTTLVSGFAFGAGLPAGRRLPLTVGRPMFGRDQCAGFAHGGTIMNEVDATGRAPLVTGPVAPALVDDDEDGWHAVGPLPAHGMRRWRRTDVRSDGRVDVLYRDSHVRPDGLETVIHEYTVAAQIDLIGPTVVSCEAVPRVLPWVECPAAAASAQRLAGLPLAGLRSHVRATFTGASTCTHLNDTLRGLEDVPTLLRLAGV